MADAHTTTLVQPPSNLEPQFQPETEYLHLRVIRPTCRNLMPEFPPYGKTTPVSIRLYHADVFSGSAHNHCACASSVRRQHGGSTLQSSDTWGHEVYAAVRSLCQRPDDVITDIVFN